MIKIDKTWTLFLDRDGVINERKFGDYVKTPEELIISDQNIIALRKLSSMFARCVVVTNQQCIAKGILTTVELDEIHESMKSKVGKEVFDAVFYAPEWASDENHTRKPRPIMAHKAKELFKEIDFTKSIMVGDTDSDIVFGQNLGMKTVLVKSNEKTTVTADLIVTNLAELVKTLFEE
jgi:histidinol-phosphate phosphatase family protein